MAVRRCRKNYYADCLYKAGNNPRKFGNLSTNLVDLELVVSNLVIHKVRLLQMIRFKMDGLNNYFISVVGELRQMIDILPGESFNFLRTLTASRSFLMLISLM